MGAARLEVVAGKAVGMSILVEDELLIGRHSEGAGRLADDDEISRAHARVSMDSRGLCAIEDLGSTNGTFLNGLRISSPQMLSEGDTIEIGGTTLVVRQVPELTTPGAAGTGRPQPTVSAGVMRPTAPAPPEPAPAAPPGEPAPAAGPPVGVTPTEPLREPLEEPLAVPEPRDTPSVPPLSLKLEVDFDAREARLFVDQASEPVLLVFDAGRWRAVSDP
jgi:pSer/pThr/pTyr-binding forkhead associated (FHA) protein